jgi:hypothetical protein
MVVFLINPYPLRQKNIGTIGVDFVKARSHPIFYDKGNKKMANRPKLKKLTPMA